MPVRATTAQMTNGDTVTITRPASVRVGDVLVWWVITDSQIGTWDFVYPAGWTRLSPQRMYHNFVATRPGDCAGVACAYRVATANEPATYVGTAPQGQNTTDGGLVVLSGVTARAMCYAHTRAVTYTPTPWRMPMRGLRVALPSELVWFGSSDVYPAGTVAHTPPAGFTMLGSYVDGTLYNNVQIAHRDLPVPGFVSPTIGSGALTGASSSFSGYLLAFPKRTALITPGRMAVPSTLATALRAPDALRAQATAASALTVRMG